MSSLARLKRAASQKYIHRLCRFEKKQLNVWENAAAGRTKWMSGGVWQPAEAEWAGTARKMEKDAVHEKEGKEEIVDRELGWGAADLKRPRL